MENKFWIIVFIFSLLLSLAIGFFAGRGFAKVEKEVKVEYIKGDTIHDSISYPVPVDVIRPADTLDIIMACVREGIYSELFPEKIVTEYIEITKEDTAEIIRDWATKRMYEETLFDNDTVGYCKINAFVQYNRISGLSYEYAPITKQVTIYKENVKVFSPYIGAGFLLNKNLSATVNVIPTINAGFFVKEKYGLNFQYGKMLENKNNLYGMSFLYKF